MKRAFVVLIALLLMSPAAAKGPDFGHCLDGLGELRLIGVSYPDADGTIYYGFDLVGGGWVGVFLYRNGDVHVQTYDNRDFWCLHSALTTQVHVITKYPLGGTRFTWAVQDRYQHWHTIVDQGVIVTTLPEKDDAGIPITRLVVSQNEPTESARYAIFDEYGHIAG